MTAKRLVIRAEFIAPWTGYHDHLLLMTRAFESWGTDVVIRGDCIMEELGALRGQIAVDIRKNLVPRQQPEDWELFLSTPKGVPSPNKRTVFFTMWESSALPAKWVANLNLAELVIVPCDWNARCFRACGVVKPIHVCHLGQDSTIYYPTQMNMTGPCVFGLAGRLAHGGTRKGINEAVGLFLRSFPTEADVRLRLKVFPDCPLDSLPGDSRIDVIRAYISDGMMADWLRSLTCFVALAKGEGWGAIQHQAMACARPVLGPIFGGVAMFMTPENCYPVGYDLGNPPKDNHYEGMGQWAIHDDASVVGQMRNLYANRHEARRKGIKAAGDMMWRTNYDSNRRLETVLKHYGFL